MNAQPPVMPVQSAVASPNRSATPLFLKKFVLAFAVVLALVCGFSFVQGNVLAPLFGLFDLAVVALVLRRVWLSGDAEDRIDWDGQRVRVVRRRGSFRQVVEFHPYWLRLEKEAGRRTDDPPRLLLGSHGRRVEVGGFLDATRRARFASEISLLLSDIRDQQLAVR